MTDPATRLDRARSVADLLDSAFELPVVGTKVGLDNIVGLFPAYGDLVAGLCSLYIVFEAYRADVPSSTLVEMLINIAVDTLVGSVPVAGDLFDIYFNSNRRNVKLFEAHVDGA